jgi:hypothetical protein
MSFTEAVILAVSANLILILILGAFTLVNAWLIRKERAARQRGKATAATDGAQREPPPSPRPDAVQRRELNGEDREGLIR